MSEFSGKVVVITGAAGGLGKAFAQGFASVGATVVVADIDFEGAQATASEIATGGTRTLAFRVDVTEKASAEQLLDSTIAEFGSVDVLINNAAIYATLTRAPFAEIEPSEWDRVMAVNVKGTWLCSGAASKRMTEGGRIINIASATVFSGSPLWMHYVASKAAVIGLTRVMARELGGKRITVNAIAPGFTLTEASLALVDDAESYGVDRGAIKRSSEPQDIVGTAVFLASDAAAYITGQTLVVDGGKQFI